MAHLPLFGAFVHHFAPQPSLVFERAQDRFKTPATDARLLFDAPLRIVEGFVVEHIGLLHQQPVEEHHFVGREQIVLEAHDVDAHGSFEFHGHRSRRKSGGHVFNTDWRTHPAIRQASAVFFKFGEMRCGDKGSNFSAHVPHCRDFCLPGAGGSQNRTRKGGRCSLLRQDRLTARRHERHKKATPRLPTRQTGRSEEAGRGFVATLWQRRRAPR